MIRFQHFEYLWLLLLIPLAIVLYVAYLRWRKGKIKKLGEPHLINQLLSGRIAGRSTTRFVLITLALFFSILGLANLQQGAQTEKAERKGIDVFFALDVSKSMLARDVQPDRLTRAKQLITRMMDKMTNDRVGLVVFAGKSYLQVPLTIDYSAAKMLLETVKPDMIPTQGTVLSDAIDLSNESFSQKEKKYKAIVLISDGEDHDEKALDAAKKAAEQGAVIYTVGIGSPQGSTIIDPATGEQKLDENGQPVITKLNEDELKSLAKATGGTYTHLTNTNQAAEGLIGMIDEMEGKSYGSVLFTDYNSYFQYFIAAALLLMIAEWIIPAASLLKKTTNTREPMSRMTKVVSTLLIIVCCGAHTVFAQQPGKKQNVKPELRKGNELYKQKKYAEAQNSYLNALQKDPTSYTGMFNMGDALYKEKKFENARQAMAASAKTTKDKKEQARSYHNIGNTFLEEKKWEEAINAYKQSLRLDPTDADTKYNLAYANAMLKKDGGGKNNKDKNKDKKDKDKKDKDKKDQDKKDQDKKDQDKKDQDKKDQDKKDGDPKDDKGDKDKPEQRPQGQPSKLSQQQAENLLNALRQEEKKLQDKKDKNKGVPVKLDKDW